MLMGATHCGIDAQVPRDPTLRVGLGLKSGEDPVPGAVSLPSAEQSLASEPLRDPVQLSPVWTCRIVQVVQSA